MKNILRPVPCLPLPSQSQAATWQRQRRPREAHIPYNKRPQSRSGRADSDAPWRPSHPAAPSPAVGHARSFFLSTARLYYSHPLILVCQPRGSLERSPAVCGALVRFCLQGPNSVICCNIGMKLFVTYSGKSTVHEDVNEYFFGFFYLP